MIPRGMGDGGSSRAGDFDGDGKADPVIMGSSPSTGSPLREDATPGQAGQGWYFWLSGSFYTCNGPFYLIMP